MANVMSRSLLPALLVCLLISPAYSQPRKEIIAGSVELAGSRISGSFRVVEPRLGGVESNGTGGACLVFSEHRGGGQACKTDRDCTLEPKYVGGSGYCVRQKNSDHGKCWMRPAETPGVAYCRRSPTTPLPMNQRIDFPVDASGGLLPVGNARPGWWRVHACLNSAAGVCADPDNPNKTTNDGPPRKIP